MDIRLTGTPEQVDAATAVLRLAFNVVDESRDYPNRPPSTLVRRYVKITAPRVDEIAGGAA
jgi:hypothetical protein